MPVPTSADELFMIRHAVLSLSLVCFLSCAPAGDGAGPDAQELAAGKADSLVCAGAALDEHGFCRRGDGKFAPAACCENSEDACAGAAVDGYGFCRRANGQFAQAECCEADACLDIEDEALAQCPDPAGSPADWAACLKMVGVGEGAAALCCDSHADALAWCGALPFPPSETLPLNECLLLEQQFSAVCFAADGTATDDFGVCLEGVGSSLQAANTCCSAFGNEFSWCPGASAPVSVSCGPSIPSPLTATTLDVDPYISSTESYSPGNADSAPPLVVTQFFRSLVLLDLIDGSSDADSIFHVPDADTFDAVTISYPAANGSPLLADGVLYFMGDAQVGIFYAKGTAIPIAEVSDFEIWGCE